MSGKPRLIELHDLLAGLQDHGGVLAAEDEEGVGFVVEAVVVGRLLPAVQRPHVNAAG